MELKLGMPVTVVLASDKTSSWTPRFSGMIWAQLATAFVYCPENSCDGCSEARVSVADTAGIVLQLSVALVLVC